LQLGLQLRDIAEHALLKRPAFELRNPPFDSVKAGGAGQREMEVHSRLATYSVISFVLSVRYPC